MKLTGKQGVLRIYDSSVNIHGAAPLDDDTIKVVKWDGSVTWNVITTDVEADDTSYGDDFIADNDDAVFIGSTSVFAMIKFLKDGGAGYAGGSGALKSYYFNGTNFDTVLSGVSDGTSTGGNCFAQDGYITFKIPKDWRKGATIIDSALADTMYWVKLMMTTSSSPDPDADVLAPVDGQYYEVPFALMDFSGPMGRAKTEELLILNRNKMDAKAHYIEGGDGRIYEPMPLSFSAYIDDTYNRTRLYAALSCANPGADQWTATGTTTKGNTQNDGSNDNPAFVEAAKKTVNIQMLWEGAYLSGTSGRKSTEGLAYYEVYFPPDQQQISEAEDGVILSCNGGVYGVTERITGFGVRY